MSNSPREFRSNGYSSEVRLKLTVDGQLYPLAKIGPSRITFRDPVELLPCEGEITMTVDGRERIWAVYLPNGAAPTTVHAVIEDRVPAVASQ